MTVDKASPYIANQRDAVTTEPAIRAKQPVSQPRHDDWRVALAISRDKLVRQRVDLFAQIRALSRQLESIDRQLDDIAHTEAAHTAD